MSTNKHNTAIEQLRSSLMVLRTNEPINRMEGKISQADHEAKTAIDIATSMQVLWEDPEDSSFIKALNHLRIGAYGIARESWELSSNKAGMVVRISNMEPDPKLVIWKQIIPGSVGAVETSPWSPTDDDIFANDWILVSSKQ